MEKTSLPEGGGEKRGGFFECGRRGKGMKALW